MELTDEDKKYLAWRDYEIGITGKGPTALDNKPEFTKPELAPERAAIFEAGLQHESARRWQAFRSTMIDTLGEDPDEIIDYED